MRFVPNSRTIIARAHSMWAFYLGLLFIWLPEIIYLAAGIDTNPRVWFILGTVAILYGIVGRLLDQSIDRSKVESPAWIAGLAVLVVGAVLWSDIRTPAPEPRLEPLPVSQTAESATMGVAVPLVARWEGLRTEAYLDPVGVPTICYGHTSGVRLGDRMSESQCQALLDTELRDYRASLHHYFTPQTISGRLTPYRDAAYTSFAYNVGTAGAGGSTATRRLNAGDIAGGCEALTWWNKAGGRVMRGLVNRRAEERDLCLRGLGTRT
ncbi:lysozyme [Pelagovum pacificum]|uniref:Lysozyme n=1 Tax=Pelagovum pacificum TaxID=2588711 RepID=A0A5C5GHI4_9RHOB|nr:lysozyme [Pelagovum pacificum]QQA43966.1 lysozyme [Pelagovum pacificum]TNY32906.1 lysozyme [Pelagovum pacificum]